MPRAIRLALLTALALIAFAGNSLLCRTALRHGDIDAASFTAIRMLSGAMMLGLLAWVRRRQRPSGSSSGTESSQARLATAHGSWLSAAALFSYAAAFSFAYLSLSAATGALLLFGAVQVTMIGHGVWRGERVHPAQWLGLAVAFAGLLILLMPGLEAPPWQGALLMLVAGAAWGVYSLRGRGAGDPLQATAGNFLRTLPMVALLSLLARESMSADTQGIAAAVISGALASGLGYAVWYTALPALRATSAAIVQLSVPVLAAVGGIAWLGEALTLRFVLAAAAVLGGIALVTLVRPTDP